MFSRLSEMVMRLRRSQVCIGFIGIVLGITAIATILGFLSSLWWGFSYFDYPRPHYCLVLVAGLIIGLQWRCRWQVKRWYLLGFIPLWLNLALLAPLWVGSESFHATHIATNNQLRLLHITFDRENSDLHPLMQFIESQAVDLVSILEVTSDSLAQLRSGLTHYHLVAAEPRPNSHGSAWFMSSRSQGLHSLTSEVIHLPVTSDRPILTLTIGVNGKPIQLVCFHTIRPQNAGSLNYQAQELEALAQWSQQQTQVGIPLIIIGDFNTPPWSMAFRHHLQQDTLVNSQLGFGLQPTWPASLPGWLRIPIDHCLHSPEFKTLWREVGAKIGSDHLPLLVEVGWNRAN